MNDFFKKTISTVAPIVATLMGGPGAGAITAGLCQLLGIPDSSSEEQIANAISIATQETIAEIKKYESQVAIKRIEESIIETQTHQKDRASARNMAIVKNDNTERNLAYFTMLGSFAVLAVLSFHQIPVAAQGLFDGFAGSWFTMAICVNAFYFGSSKSSRNKDRDLYNSIPTTPSMIDKLKGLVDGKEA